MSGSTDNGEGGATVYLPVTHSREVDVDQAFLAVKKWLAVMSHQWHLATATFACSLSEGKLTMGWRINGSESATAGACAEAIRLSALATITWLGLGDPTPTCPWVDPGPASYVFDAVPHASGDLVPVRALAWIGANEGDASWHLALTLHSMSTTSSPARHASSRQTVSEAAASSLYELFATDHAGIEQGIPASLALYGRGVGGDTVAALVAEDTRGSFGLEPHPARPGHPVPMAWMPIDLIAHLLSLPARVPGMLPAHPPAHPDELFNRLSESVSGHRLILGASGHGKTTLLAHLGAEGAARGQLVVTVDVHDGALIRTLAHEERRLGLDPLVVRFVDPAATNGAFPSLDLLAAPPGVSLDAWADALWALFRWVVWADMTTREIGKVGERSGRGLLRASVSDPVRETELTDWPALLDPSDGMLARLLDRIGDPDLTRLFRREIMPMITSPTADNAAIWLISLVEPVIGNPATAAVLGSPDFAIPLEQAIADGRSVLIHAPATVLGDAGSSLISAAVMYRASLTVRRTPPSSGALFIADEFTRHPSATYERDVAEIRKFGVGYILATQSLHQMTTRLREIMLANVGSVMTFRASPRDAAHLDELFPTVSTRTMQTLPRHHVALTTFSSDAVLATPPPLPVPDHVDTWLPQSRAVGVPDPEADLTAFRSGRSVGSADARRRARLAPPTESRRS